MTVSEKGKEMESNVEAAEDNNGISFKGLLAGTIIGGLIGVLAALLLTPKSGREVRTDLSDRTNTVIDLSRVFGDSAKEKFNEIKSVTREKSKGFADNIKASSETTKDSIQTEDANEAATAEKQLI